ncbi:Uncharacterised protein [Salmonella enterica subsp. enterica]|uniref:Uncharacterized protein n=1 Tax=Salmonella enterica I TaxID=59201 RepID=A0A379Y1S1_SALET|nr:Uncharacterised protein [Salmonella enterica subsp. enterica]
MALKVAIERIIDAGFIIPVTPDQLAVVVAVIQDDNLKMACCLEVFDIDVLVTGRNYASLSQRYR